VDVGDDARVPPCRVRRPGDPVSRADYDRISAEGKTPQRRRVDVPLAMLRDKVPDQPGPIVAATTG
jgi:hypothetical protein